MQLHSLFEEWAKAARVPVRGKSHDFIFIRIEIEAEMERQDRVKNPNRIIGGNFLQLIDLVVVGMVCRHALRFAHSVNHYDEAFLPTRGVESARGMR